MSRLACATAALLLAAAAPPGAAGVELPEIEFESYELDNGLGVILYEDHSTPIAAVNIWYHVGSKNERPGRSGFAHLFEHMMFQGSEHQDREYISAIQGLGGQVNGSTSEDRTNYWEIVPKSRLRAALLLEADRLGWLLPAMTQEKFENQQDVVRNERRQSEGQPYSAYWLEFNENFYPKGHPYDHSVIGIHEDLANATLEDVTDFFRTYYTPNNATLVVAGDFDPAEVKGWIRDYFGPIPPGPPVSEVSTWIPRMSGEKRVTYQDRVQLPRLYWAWHTPPYYAEGDADLDLAAKILGQGRTSRLHRRLVHEEKLAQDVGFSVYSQQISSVAALTVTLRPDADRARVEAIVNEELARFAKDGPTVKEIERAKNDFEASFVKGIQRIGSWGGISDRLNRYNHYVGTPDWFRQDYERYVTRTRETVRSQFARWIGPDRMHVAILPFPELGATEVADVVRDVLPEPAGEDAFDKPVVARAELPNGLKVAVLEQHELPLVRADLVFGAGSAADPAELAGVCDLAAAMHLEGTRKRDKFSFSSELEFLGTDLWNWTDEDRTTFGMLALESRFDESLALLAEALTSATFPAAEFDDEKERRLVDIRRQKDSPWTISRRITRRLLYGEDHPYGRLDSGTERTMGAIELEDARAFSSRHFTPGNATLVVVGDVTLDAVLPRIERALGSWQGGAAAKAAIPAPPARQGRTVYLVDKPGDTQSTISIGHAGLPRDHPDWHALYVANRVLGDFFSSRLNLNLREDKGYTYGVRSTATERAATGLFTMGGRVQAEVTAPALTEFLSELEGVVGARPITEEELRFAKDSIVLDYPREFETIGQLAGALGDQITFGLPDDAFATYPDRIEAVDLAGVNRIAREYLRPKDVAILVIGDLSKIEADVRALDLGPVVKLDRTGDPVGGAELSSR